MEEKEFEEKLGEEIVEEIILEEVLVGGDSGIRVDKFFEEKIFIIEVLVVINKSRVIIMFLKREDIR